MTLRWLKMFENGPMRLLIVDTGWQKLQQHFIVFDIDWQLVKSNQYRLAMFRCLEWSTGDNCGQPLTMINECKGIWN